MTLLFDPYQSIVLFLSGKFNVSPADEFLCNLNILDSTYGKLRRSRRKIELAGGHHPHEFVTSDFRRVVQVPNTVVPFFRSLLDPCGDVLVLQR